VIIRPVVSEKSYVLATADKYTFRVHDKAHKTQIKQAVEALFDVHVVEVRTSKVPSKPKRRGVTAGAPGRGRRPWSRCVPARPSRSSKAWKRICKAMQRPSAPPRSSTLRR
jgi:ribosomal protein L23